MWWSFCVALLLYLLPVNFSSLKSCFGLDFLFAGFLPADATHGAVLTADGDLEDKLSDAMDDEWPMVALKLASWADVDALADYQYMIRKPLCLICDDAELLEAGLRAYQGRALYEGNLTEDALAPLVEKYGLLV